LGEHTILHFRTSATIDICRYIIGMTDSNSMAWLSIKHAIERIDVMLV
jgi:hypothetical protein